MDMFCAEVNSLNPRLQNQGNLFSVVITVLLDWFER
jgi:hypothetical protein